MFFKKKKLIEIDGKIDFVLEQLNNYNEKHEDILSEINRIKSILKLLEGKILDSQSVTSQCVQDSKVLIIEKISYLKESLQMYSDEINQLKDDFLKSQEEANVTLGELLSKSVSDDGTISREKIEKLTKELYCKLEVMDSSMRLLLLNSVMDQIEE